jgi:T5orf172 domain
VPGKRSGALPDHLYIVGESEESSCVKIGRSVNPKARLGGIQTGYPRRLQLLHVEQDAGHLEPHVHDLLVAWRTVGEWFDFQEAGGADRGRRAVDAVKALREIGAAFQVDIIVRQKSLHTWQRARAGDDEETAEAIAALVMIELPSLD